MKTVKIHPSRGWPAALIAMTASNRATLLLLTLLAVAIVIYYQVSLAGRLWLIVIPAMLLIVNFVCAVASRGILKNNWPLMVFHFALIALVALAFLGQMSRFRGTLELARDEVFSGQIENITQGPWHRYGLTQARFTNLGFQIRYNKGIKRDKTLNRIALTAPDGSLQLLEIGDHVPLVIGHYRFYTSHNKGYAPVFEWRPSESTEVVVGSIHLPAYPTHEFGQALEWRIPGGGQTLWTMLKFEDELLPPDRAFEFRIPQQHRIVIRDRDRRHELRPGDEISLPGGTLRYRNLSTWMGYKVDYDWTRPWLLATAIIGLIALFTHYIFKFSLLGEGVFSLTRMNRAGSG